MPPAARPLGGCLGELDELGMVVAGDIGGQGVAGWLRVVELNQPVDLEGEGALTAICSSSRPQSRLASSRSAVWSEAAGMPPAG